MVARRDVAGGQHFGGEIFVGELLAGVVLTVSELDSSLSSELISLLAGLIASSLAELSVREILVEARSESMTSSTGNIFTSPTGKFLTFIPLVSELSLLVGDSSMMVGRIPELMASAGGSWSIFLSLTEFCLRSEVSALTARELLAEKSMSVFSREDDVRKYFLEGTSM